MKVLVTGASGFVGRALAPKLADKGHVIVSVGRQEVGEFGPTTDWAPHLDGIGAVVHLAARVHVMVDNVADPIAEFRRVNTQGTAALAKEAKSAGVSRFVNLSSIKVNGDASEVPFSAADIPAPTDPYGISKWEAEQLLNSFANALEIVTLRPPLVYGPGVKGNFLKLIHLVSGRRPLPLASVRKKRSFISSSNLADAICWALSAQPGTYLPSDGDDKSTPELITAIAKALGIKPSLFRCPVSLLRIAGGLTGKSSVIQRLTGSLTVDNNLPGWHPPHSFESSIIQTIQWYQDHNVTA